jgi:hypothetical protein
MPERQQPERVKQALEHPCPRCKSPAGIGCGRPSGSMLPSHTVHAAREAIVDRLQTDDGPPSALSTNHGREMWRVYADTLRERGEWHAGTRRILLSALRFAEEAESALERAAAEPECIGSTGNAIANPQFAVARGAQERWFAGLERLMLTPSSRVGATAGHPAPGDKGDALDALDAQARAGSNKRRG